MLMFVLHLITLVYCIRENEKRTGSILGIVTSAVGWIPFLGMIMHIITAIILLIDAAKSSITKSELQPEPESSKMVE
jgi:hypothetical protein